MLQTCVKSSNGVDTASCAKLLLAVFDEEVIDNFVESLRTDRLARFI